MKILRGAGKLAASLVAAAVGLFLAALSYGAWWRGQNKNHHSVTKQSYPLDDAIEEAV